MILEKVWNQLQEELKKQTTKDIIFEIILQPFGMYIFQLSLPYLVGIIILLIINAVIIGITLFKVSKL
jgi:hypothetical protein